MLLLGSLKDQEENLIVVIRGHRGERRKDIPKNQQLFPLQQGNVTATLWLALGVGMGVYRTESRWVNGFKEPVCRWLGLCGPSFLMGGRGKAGEGSGSQNRNTARSHLVEVL
jgi:hypothetical protein